MNKVIKGSLGFLAGSALILTSYAVRAAEAPAAPPAAVEANKVPIVRDAKAVEGEIKAAREKIAADHKQFGPKSEQVKADRAQLRQLEQEKHKMHAEHRKDLKKK